MSWCSFTSVADCLNNANYNMASEYPDPTGANNIDSSLLTIDTSCPTCTIETSLTHDDPDSSLLV